MILIIAKFPNFVIFDKNFSRVSASFNPSPRHLESPSSASVSERRQKALEYLNNRTNFEKKRSIPYTQMGERLHLLRQALEFLGRPDQNFHLIHIAGTKGKGTTALFLEKILRDQGWKTGVFSSPHLLAIEERFLINGSPCLPDDLTDSILELQNQLKKFSPASSADWTFFELTVLAGFLLFQRQGVDFVLWETGLGGRLDATNICEPDLAIITSVSFDHQKQLGETLAEISREKAGIVKENVPVLSGILANLSSVPLQKELAALPERFQKTALSHEKLQEAETVLRETARQKNAPYFSVTQLSPDVQNLPLQTIGLYQRWNAQLALTALDIGQELGLKNLKKNNGKTGPFRYCREKALASLCSLKLPARGEIISENPLCLIDGAHNRASFAALTASIQQHWPNHYKTLFFAALYEKDIDGMLMEALPAFHQIILTTIPSHPRSLPETELAKAADAIFKEIPSFEPFRNKILVAGDYQPILQNIFSPTKCKKTALSPDNHLYCFAGSFYFAAKILEGVQKVRKSGNNDEG